MGYLGNLKAVNLNSPYIDSSATFSFASSKKSLLLSVLFPLKEH